MKLVTGQIKKKLIKNWDKSGDDTLPALKIFSPAGAATWLIMSMDPEDEDTMFGLCDLGMGCAELGYVSLSELAGSKVPVRMTVGAKNVKFGVNLERDLHFHPEHPLMVYYQAAWEQGGITENPAKLEAAAAKRAQAKAAATTA